MANTYKQIGSTVTVGSGGAVNIEFTSIPATFTDLVIFTSLRSSRTPSTDGTHIAFTVNNNNGNIYSFRHIRGTGSATSSYSESLQTSINLYSQGNSSANTTNTFSNNFIYIPNYSSSNNKSISVDSVYENNATESGHHLLAGSIVLTSAITSIKLAEASGNNWVEYTTASLYGIKSS